MKNEPRKIINLIAIAFIVYLMVDYVNFPSLMGLIPASINVDVFGVFFNAVIVLVLYVISFYYVENRQNEKDANARGTVDILLEKTYKECLDNLILLDNRDFIEKFIIPKVDGNKTDSENKVIHNLQTLPFSSYDAIITLAINGHIEKDKFSNYLDIKKEYQYLISIKITFFDLDAPETDDQKKLYNDIHARDSVLKSKLEKFS